MDSVVGSEASIPDGTYDRRPLNPHLRLAVFELADTDTPDLTRTLDLVRNAQRGHRESLERVCARYYPRVLRIVRARLPADLRAVLEISDIAQAVFAKAVRSFDQFECRTDASLIHWLARIVQSEIRDHQDFYRAKQRDVSRQRRFETRMAAGLGPGTSDDRVGPLEQAETEERYRQLTEALAALPDAAREQILLRYYCGFTWAEVAEQLGASSADAARKAHAAALVALQVELARRGVSD